MKIEHKAVDLLLDKDIKTVILRFSIPEGHLPAQIILLIKQLPELRELANSPHLQLLLLLLQIFPRLIIIIVIHILIRSMDLKPKSRWPDCGTAVLDTCLGTQS